jgi:hypothetical protein
MPSFSLENESNGEISGQEDMGVEGIWKRMGVEVTNPQQYHL